MRENIDAKGRRLLIEGRVYVTAVSPGIVRARVRGDRGELYRAGFEWREWRCDCPARGRCSHLVAVQLITIRPKDNDA